ncbi:MAG: nickel-dependent hydrogenase large subunit [Anaerolineae bacterium]|nr:nickel-dependent hydrogenase large subunit [Anaerolineae bacterium]
MNDQRPDITTQMALNKPKHVIDIVVENGKVTHLQLQRLESARFIETFLYNQDFQAASAIMTQIQGFCTTSCQLATVHALEKVLGITVSAKIQALRDLLNCASWIENHAFHIYLRHAPRLLGYDNAIAMAAIPTLKPIIDRGLRLRQFGQTLRRIVSGEDKYTNCLCVGGFYQTPTHQDLLALNDELAWGLEAALQTVTWTANFDLPDFTSAGDFVAFHHPTEYPMFEGQTVLSKQSTLSHEDIRRYLTHTNGVKNGNSSYNKYVPEVHYFVGPLARLNHNFQNLAPAARSALAETGLCLPNRNPFTSIIARSIELVQAIEKAQSIIENYVQPVPSRLPVAPKAGDGSHLAETPFGLLKHDYSVNEHGIIQKVAISTPTMLSLSLIKQDLSQFLPTLLDLSPNEILRRCEQLVYCYEPGISKTPMLLDLKIRSGHA